MVSTTEETEFKSYTKEATRKPEKITLKKDNGKVGKLVLLYNGKVTRIFFSCL